MNRSLHLLALLVGCAVPELDRGGAIVCGAANEPNGGCPTGFTCSAARCCPNAALDGGVCPTLPAACEGQSCTAAGLIVGRPCTALPQCQNPAMGEVQLCAQGAQIPGGYCTATCRNIGASCGNDQGICVSARAILGLTGGVCLRTCRLPAGVLVARCRAEGAPNQYVCVQVPGTTFTACVPDCKAVPCGSGQVCDERTRVCVFPGGGV